MCYDNLIIYIIFNDLFYSFSDFLFERFNRAGSSSVISTNQSFIKNHLEDEEIKMKINTNINFKLYSQKHSVLL